MRLVDLLTAPPGSWRFQEERTGHWMTAITFMDLVRKVSQHRANMKYSQVNAPFETLDTEVEDWICRKMVPEDITRLCTGNAPSPTYQPGNLLSHLIHQVTGRYAQTCGTCLQRMQQMNAWGWIECFHRRDEILGWLKEEAGKRGTPISDSAALTLFRAAWREIVLQKHSNEGLPDLEEQSEKTVPPAQL